MGFNRVLWHPLTTSDPASGSVMARQMIFSPRSTPGHTRCFSSSEANFSTGGQPIDRPPNRPHSTLQHDNRNAIGMHSTRRTEANANKAYPPEPQRESSSVRMNSHQAAHATVTHNELLTTTTGPRQAASAAYGPTGRE